MRNVDVSHRAAGIRFKFDRSDSYYIIIEIKNYDLVHYVTHGHAVF